MIFPPEVWGPFYWHTIHIVSMGYPVTPTYSDKKAAKDFYESLQFLIPCAICRTHYTEHLRANPITPSLDSREHLIKWSIDIHNAVNKMLNKPTWTPEEVFAYYKRLGETRRSPVWTAAEFAAADSRALAYGITIGAATAIVAAGAITWSMGLWHN